MAVSDFLSVLAIGFDGCVSHLQVTISYRTKLSGTVWRNCRSYPETRLQCCLSKVSGFVGLEFQHVPKRIPDFRPTI